MKAVEIRQAIRVCLIRPGEPELLDLVAQVGIANERRGFDAVADEVGRESLAGIGGIAVGHYQLARARQEPRATRGDQRVDILKRRVPAAQAALGHRPLEARAHGFRAARLGAAEHVDKCHVG